MKIFFAVVIILTGLSCTKEQQDSSEKKQPPPVPSKCGTLLATPVLDSFVYPTYYITALVAFPEGNETVHFHDNVTGDHDGSWFLPKYSKDSTLCITP